MKTFLKYLAVFVVLLLLAVLIFLFRPTVSKKIQTSNNEPVVDAVLVGGGIMSATLGTYLTELEPNWQIRMYERLDQVAQESSNGFNNAGTGHSGFMEMNYTSEKDGKIKHAELLFQNVRDDVDVVFKTQFESEKVVEIIKNVIGEKSSKG